MQLYAKTCKDCGLTASGSFENVVAFFYKHSQTLRGRWLFQTRCSRCHTKRSYQKYPEKHDGTYSEAYYDRQYKYKYGITKAQVDAIRARGCEACGKAEGKLVIDHDHTTGKVRGCLCGNCNTALGMLKDDPRLVESLLAYISLHQDTSTNTNIIPSEH